MHLSSTEGETPTGASLRAVLPKETHKLILTPEFIFIYGDESGKLSELLADIILRSG